jgi:hypothetical protein
MRRIPGKFCCTVKKYYRKENAKTFFTLQQLPPRSADTGYLCACLTFETFYEPFFSIIFPHQ